MPEYSESEIADIMFQFPTAFAQAQVDWAKYKAGVKAGLFMPEQRRDVVNFFQEFPKLWAVIRPNFLWYPDGRPKPSHAVDFAKKVDAWIATLGAENQTTALGLPFLVIAGVLIAASFGVAGAVWAVGYLKRQQNITALISGVVDGRLPVGVLQDAILKEQGTFLSPVVDVLKWGAFALGVYLLAPVVLGALKKK